jgi:hypothetical protein
LADIISPKIDEFCKRKKGSVAETLFIEFIN